MSKEETQVCKWCGRELPIDKFKSKQSYTNNVCKDCYNGDRREKRYRQRLSDELEKYNNGELVKIRRKYKKPQYGDFFSEKGADRDRTPCSGKRAGLYHGILGRTAGNLRAFHPVTDR